MSRRLDVGRPPMHRTDRLGLMAATIALGSALCTIGVSLWIMGG